MVALPNLILSLNFSAINDANSNDDIKQETPKPGNCLLNCQSPPLSLPSSNTKHAFGLCPQYNSGIGEFTTKQG